MKLIQYLDVVIVNYQNYQHTTKCIETIASRRYMYNIFVVDNSEDDTPFILLKKIFSNVYFFRNLKNEGFGRANNKGASLGKGLFVLFVNSDIFLSGTTIDVCLDIIVNNKDIGLLGCKLINEDGSSQKSTYSVANFRKLLDQNIIVNKLWPMGKEPIEAVMGSFMLIPRKVFEETGGFDPDFFMYSEELELCHRIARKGYKIEYFEGATATHINGGSTTNKEWSMKQRHLSNALLFLKVRGYSGYMFYLLLFLFNTFTNFFAMWLLDSTWRNSFWKEQRYYFSNFGHYLSIPFLYSKKPGNGKRLLKRDS
jgi:GT2 family glycosyltransferase